jgi:protein tyrosine/serine phosphatase
MPKRGADRTGTVIACYRIAHNQWPNQEALDEARTFGMSWTERGMRNYVLYYEAVRR